MNWFIRAKPETGMLFSPCGPPIPFSHSWRNIPRGGISPLLLFKSNKCFSQQLGSALESEWIYLEPGSESHLYQEHQIVFCCPGFSLPDYIFRQKCNKDLQSELLLCNSMKTHQYIQAHIVRHLLPANN